MSGKNTASQERDSVKISKLGEELNVDPREIVAVAKEMAIENAKVPASWVTAGQADRLRAKFGGNKELKAHLERKQRYLETGELETETKPEPVGTPQPVMGKETYEKDRRKIFGVVETPGGVRVESYGMAGLHAKPAVSGITRPAPKAPEPVQTSSDSTTPAAEGETAGQPAKKFIGVQVVPPIRREPQQSDPRFGVVQAAPEPEKPAASTPTNMDVWGKLNDGRAPIDMAPTEKIEAPAPVEEIHELEEVKTEAAPVAKAPAPVSTPAPVKAAPVATVEELPPEDKKYVPLPPKIHEVPVKWQPKHKAFGAKHKVKQSKLKHIETVAKSAEKKPKEKAHADAPRKHEAPKHQTSHAAPQKKQSERKHEKPEGLLSRLAKKFLGKK